MTNITPRFVRIADVLDITAIRSRSTIWQMIKEGRFPPPRRIGARAIAWPLHDIVDWMESRPVLGSEAYDGAKNA